MAELWALKPMTVMGLMSGTSMDAVDACCVRLSMDAETCNTSFKILGTATTPLPMSVRHQLQTCMYEQQVAFHQLVRLQVEIGDLFAETALNLMAAHGLSFQDIDAIGSHGQTLYHQPPGRPEDSERPVLGYSIQIGEPSIIAERTGITTVADFRVRDMAAGGHGAPLVSFADQLLFQDSTHTRCVQNIGGIANVTVVPPAGKGDLLAFDTGPGNMLIDGAMQTLFDQPFDRDGQVASLGTVHEPLFAELMNHPFFEQPAPKSTGREEFGLLFFHQARDRFPDIRREDWVATLTAYTAQSIAEAYRHFVLPKYDVSHVIVGGGGTKNPVLMEHLRQALQAQKTALQVQTHEDYGIPNAYKEALAFAILAWTALQNVPNSLPSCTGAGHASVLGKIIPVGALPFANR